MKLEGRRQKALNNTQFGLSTQFGDRTVSVNVVFLSVYIYEVVW